MSGTICHLCLRPLVITKLAKAILSRSEGANVLLLTRRHLLSLAAGITASALVPSVAASLPPIEEEGFVTIGGIDQWVAIRGRDRSPPGHIVPAWRSL